MRAGLIPMLAIQALVVSSCIEVGYWLDLVGRWQDIEAPALELEFTKGGTFTEYLFGQPTSYGDFYAEGHIITLSYRDCDPSKAKCSVRLGFSVTGDTLVIRDSQGDIRYRRSGSP